MIIYSKVSKIFCNVDEFCKEYDDIVEKQLLRNPSGAFDNVQKRGDHHSLLVSGYGPSSISVSIM